MATPAAGVHAREADRPWFREVTADQWRAFLAAYLGWMLDGGAPCGDRVPGRVSAGRSTRGWMAGAALAGNPARPARLLDHEMRQGESGVARAPATSPRHGQP